MPHMMMSHDEDPKNKLLEDLGDLSEIELFHNQVLLAVYIRPQKTKSGIYLTDKTTDEDRYQSKVGLVLKKGPTAFVDPEGKWFDGITDDVNEWVVFRPSDGWNITVNGVLCRIIEDISVRGRSQTPDMVW